MNMPDFRDKLAIISMEYTLPAASERVAELVTRLQAHFGRKDGEKDGEKAEALRYDIYARKSTDTAEKLIFVNVFALDALQSSRPRPSGSSCPPVSVCHF